MKYLKYLLILIIIGAIGTFITFLVTAKTDVISQSATPTDTPKPYISTLFNFTITPQPGFTLQEAYLNQTLGPGREIPGIAFQVPEQLTKGTNLSADSYIAVEKLPDVDCEPGSFLDSATSVETVAIGTNTFVKSSASDAGAGNLYIDTVYVVGKGDACYSVRTVEHTTNILNYEPGTVKEYDRKALQKDFIAMIESLTLN